MKLPSLVGKRWNPLLPVDHLTKNHLTIHPTAKYSHDMWKRACDTSNQLMAEGKNEAEIILPEGFSRKHPVFPVRFPKSYFQTGENDLPFRNNTYTPQEIVKVEDSPCSVKKILKDGKLRLNGKHQRQYLVRFKKNSR
ncbi:hypothetical protein O181_003386 [Austropuccinia psidii MF-1]|uniref:Uncharacterized protein n=1 Tax=Austropuccinia psidii MF-1 TaxID=1389203 RepID=A0A9Q3BEV6_9BASI|nr:hypothetical protein [Austropuccinia psidii MF-1]